MRRWWRRRYSALVQRGWRDILSGAVRRFLGDNERGKDIQHDGREHGGEEGKQGKDDADDRRVSAHPVGDAPKHAGDEPIVAAAVELSA
jgi:hypothetical protein